MSAERLLVKGSNWRCRPLAVHRKSPKRTSAARLATGLPLVPVDFQIDPAAERIDFRSRSLLGLFDFGKNRSRMQDFALRFQAPA